MAYNSKLSPSYYKRGKAPVWDFIRDQGLNFHLGNAVKYICRAGYKNSAEEDALLNARLARILTADDYDFDKQQPKQWTPATDYKVNDGAGSKVKVTL